MNISIVQIFIPEGIARHIALYDGMGSQELKDLLLSCFHGCEVIGLQNTEGIVYPISLLLKNPSFFGNKKFAAVVKNNIVGLIEDAKPNGTSETKREMTFTEENPMNKNNSSLVSNQQLVPAIADGEMIESNGKDFSIAEAKTVLGLGQYSSEFIIDFLIGLIADDGDDSSDGSSSWLISKEQFDSAMSQLAYHQYSNFTAEQKSLSDYVVLSLFVLFDEERTGYCDLRELGCGLMLFSGGEIIDRAQMAYKLVAETKFEDDDDVDNDGRDEGVNTDMMTLAIASVLKVVAVLNKFYLNSCDPLVTAEEITKRAFIRAKLLLSNGSTISQEDFEYWFSVVLTIYNEIEEKEDIQLLNGDAEDEELFTEEEETPTRSSGTKNGSKNLESFLFIDTESAKYDADADLENGDVRTTMAPNHVVLELQKAKYVLGLTGVAAEDLMELLGEVSCEGMLSDETWDEFLSEFVVGDKSEKKMGIELGRKIFQAFDLYGEKAVPYIDFCAGLAFLSDSPIEDKIMVAFVLNDTESVGMITVPELMNLILGSLRVVMACAPSAAARVQASNISLEKLSQLTVLEGLAVMELTPEDSLTLETVSEIALKCVALSAN